MPGSACDIHTHFILRTQSKDPIIKLDADGARNEDIM
jgi:hypothetical protein